MLYRWLLSAKRPETIQKRIRQIIKSAQTGKDVFGSAAKKDI